MENALARKGCCHYWSILLAPRLAKADLPKNKFSSDWLGRYFLSLRGRWFRGFPTLRRKSCATMSEKFLNLISAESLFGLSKRTFSYLMYIVANDVPVLETLSEIPGSFNAFLRESYTARFSALQDRWWPTTRVWLLSPSNWFMERSSLKKGIETLPLGGWLGAIRGELLKLSLLAVSA